MGCEPKVVVVARAIRMTCATGNACGVVELGGMKGNRRKLLECDYRRVGSWGFGLMVQMWTGWGRRED